MIYNLSTSTYEG